MENFDWEHKVIRLRLHPFECNNFTLLLVETKMGCFKEGVT